MFLNVYMGMIYMQKKEYIILFHYLFIFYRKPLTLGFWTRCLPDRVICSLWRKKPWARPGTNFIVIIKEKEDCFAWFPITKPRAKWCLPNPLKALDSKLVWEEYQTPSTKDSVLTSLQKTSKKFESPFFTMVS